MKLPKDVPILKNWVWDNVWKIYWGFIYNDPKKRFPDGTWIHTSSIPDEKYRNKKRGGCYIQTLNTKYYLGKKRTK